MQRGPVQILADAELTERAQNGDADAFANLSRRPHQPPLTRIGCRIEDRQPGEEVGNEA